MFSLPRIRWAAAGSAASVVLALGCGQIFEYPEVLPENTAQSCNDGLDNDLDGKTDCRDEDCQRYCPVVTDECEQDAPPSPSSNVYHDLDLTGFKSDQPDLPFCLDNLLARGKDFFLAAKMMKGDKWHFHARGIHTMPDGSVENLDPAVYILSGCNDVERSCVTGVNNCGSGKDEHLTFEAPSTQTYYVGVDYVGTAEVPSAGSDVQLVAVQPLCGNNIIDHPEFCDDGNTDPNDGCDQCHQALKSGEDETSSSKNDGPLDATILLLDPDQLAKPKPYTFTVTGTFTTDCDFDFYEFDLSGQPSFTTVTAELSGTDALCSHADLKLLVDPKPGAPFELDAASSSCPIVTGPMVLEPGKHLVRVNSLSSVMPALPSYEDKSYTLTLTFAAP